MIDLRQTGSVGKGSDHLQLIKFWPSSAPGKRVCGEAKIYGSVLSTDSAQCLRLSECFFSLHTAPLQKFIEIRQQPFHFPANSHRHKTDKRMEKHILLGGGNK